MKTKLVLSMMAVSGLLVAPIFADHHGEEKATASEAASAKVAAYVVTASGGG